MARTPAQKAALEKQALKSENKSDGMRQLFDAGYETKEIAALFGAPYGFVYGVGTRHGAITSTPREAKPKTAKAKAPAKAAAKAPARPSAKTATAKAPARAAKAPAKAASKSKATAKA